MRWPAVAVLGYNGSRLPGNEPARTPRGATRGGRVGTVGTMSWNDLIGRRLDRYVIVDELGRGGSSRVYRAHDTTAEQDVAIKVIPNDAEDRVGFVRRFDREVEVVRQLDHPNIVAVQDRGETDDLVYLVMQLVGGGTLRARMGKPLPLGEACAAIVQMAHALHHAHVRGIVHRDVKPSNMLISEDDPRHLLLTDFGIAKIQGHRGLTKSGTTVGTPEYMSPEQAEGKETDPRSDVYSLGCVLYEELAGRPPFVGATPVSVLYQQVHARPSYLRSFNSEVPRELGRIVEQALAKRPEERFGTALHFARALLPFVEGCMPPIELPEEPEARVMPPPRISSPTLGAGWDGQPAATGGLGGLGTEGLDALFPEDIPSPARRTMPAPDAPAADAPVLGQTPPAMPPAPPMARSKHTIPLNQFRLPARPTRPLELPLTLDGKLDIEALMARVEAEGAAGAPPPSPLAAPAPWDRPLRASPATGYTWGAPPARARTTGDLPDLYADRPPVAAVPSLLPPPAASPRPSPTRAPHSQPSPVWRPPEDDLAPAAARRRRRLSLPGGRMMAGIAAAVFLVASLGIWLAVSASALGSLAHSGDHSSATATKTVTPSPSPSPTASPTQTASPTVAASPTTDPQKVLDARAAASFRAITLATFNDGACSAGNASTRFSSYDTIVVNLCASSSGAPGPMTVVMRQGQQTLYQMANGVPVSAGSHYWYSRYGLAPGSYDVLVTMTVDGKPATAADIQFTVG